MVINLSLTYQLSVAFLAVQYRLQCHNNFRMCRDHSSYLNGYYHARCVAGLQCLLCLCHYRLHRTQQVCCELPEGDGDDDDYGGGGHGDGHGDDDVVMLMMMVMMIVMVW